MAMDDHDALMMARGGMEVAAMEVEAAMSSIAEAMKMEEEKGRRAIVTSPSSSSSMETPPLRPLRDGPRGREEDDRVTRPRRRNIH